MKNAAPEHTIMDHINAALNQCPDLKLENPRLHKEINQPLKNHVPPEIQIETDIRNQPDYTAARAQAAK